MTWGCKSVQYYSARFCVKSWLPFEASTVKSRFPMSHFRLGTYNFGLVSNTKQTYRYLVLLNIPLKYLWDAFLYSHLSIMNNPKTCQIVQRISSKSLIFFWAGSNLAKDIKGSIHILENLKRTRNLLGNG